MTDMDWDGIYHFKRSEFACKCGNCDESSADNMGVDVVEALDAMRSEYQKPIRVTSGWRCANHPAERTKDKPGSHNRGMAVDVACRYSEAFDILELAIKSGTFARIGIQQKGDGRFLHLQMCDDIQPTRTIFSY